ncbi:MAG: signal peptide peptidase SppA, partial [Pseudomonadota bacterium]
MSLEAELYEERRRKWRRSGFWRGVFVVAALVAVVLGIRAFSPEAGPEPHIARHSVLGIIYNDPVRDDLIRGLADDANVRAVILEIDSPGGTTVGAEAIHDAIRAVAVVKPVVAVLGEVAASGGYIAAIGADHIVARGNTLTGSIGVIMEYPNFSGLLDDLGVSVETVRSSSVKGGASPLRPTSEAERAEQRALIDDSYQWFRGLVGEARGLEGPALDTVADGGVFTGRQALSVGLIDEIGGENAALIHLESLNDELIGLPILDHFVPEEELSPLDLVLEQVGVRAFLPEIARKSGAR